MRKTTIATIVALIAVGVGLWVVLARPFGASGEGLLRELATSFMEDLQFKDFRSSKLYSHELDQERLDIGKTLERLFQIKPEFLDIRDHEIVRSEVDSSGERAKVVVRTRYKLLNQDRGVEEKDVVLYWIKRNPDCPLGGSCDPSGSCVDEGGKPMYKPEDEEDKKKQQQPNSDAKPHAEAEDKGLEVYECDPSAPDAWTMNLDSTLKEKEYQ